jgi:hypothetical protein
MPFIGENYDPSDGRPNLDDDGIRDVDGSRPTRRLVIGRDDNLCTAAKWYSSIRRWRKHGRVRYGSTVHRGEQPYNLNANLNLSGNSIKFPITRTIHVVYAYYLYM